MNSVVLYETFVSVVRRRLTPPRSVLRAPAAVWAWVAMVCCLLGFCGTRDRSARSRAGDRRDEGHRSMRVAAGATRLLTAANAGCPVAENANHAIERVSAS